MKKGERHNTAPLQRAPLLRFFAMALLTALVFVPFFDMMHIEKDAPGALLLGVVIVAALLGIGAYRLALRRVAVSCTAVQYSAAAFALVAAFAWCQRTLTFDTFFGVANAAHGYLSVLLFSLCIVLMPMLRVTRQQIRHTLVLICVLPIVLLPFVVLQGITATAVYSALLALFVGAFALPLYKVTLRVLSVALSVTGVSLGYLWYGHTLLPKSIEVILFVFSAVANTFRALPISPYALVIPYIRYVSLSCMPDCTSLSNTFADCA